jgi:hypothetical protein
MRSGGGYDIKQTPGFYSSRNRNGSLVDRCPKTRPKRNMFDLTGADLLLAAARRVAGSYPALSGDKINEDVAALETSNFTGGGAQSGR